ncbi:MAG: 30S ribosome-binding factor RbfA [Endomicrobiia bacterium]
MKNFLYRTYRVRKQLHREIANIISNLKDPRANNITITEVELSSDLRTAKIYYTVIGNNIQDIKEMFNSAKGFIRSSLAQKLNLKHAVDIEFIYDKFLEKAFRVITILDKIKDEESNK